MSNVYDIDDYREGAYLFAALAMCIDCEYRWLAGVPPETSLFMLECPLCGECNSFASILPSEYLSKFEDQQ